MHGLSATASGIALIPLALTTPGSLLAGRAMLYWRHYKRAPIIGLIYPVTTVSIQNAVPHYQVGIAMGALNFFRALASAFAVAVMGAILLAGLGVTPQRGGPCRS